MVTIHTVKSGESLIAIARQYGVQLKALIGMNPQVTDPSAISVGQKITVPSATPPMASSSGSVPQSGKVTCCPSTAQFLKPAKPVGLAHGFDDKTNSVDTANHQFPYWNTGQPSPNQYPAKGSLSIPSPKTTRDGANWVSVGVGKEIDIEAEMFDVDVACFTNVTFESQSATIADVVTVVPTTRKGPFKLKGVAEGETTLIAKCNGNVLGWVHVWCVQPVKIIVDVASIVVLDGNNKAHSRAAKYVLADLEAYINDVYAQMWISVKLQNAGETKVAPKIIHSKKTAVYLNSLDDLAIQSNPQLSAGRYRLYYYVDTKPHSGGLGIVSNGLGKIGPGFSFFDHDIQGSYNTMAHEFGHLLNLSHPLHDFNKDEFPPHHLASLNGNVMAADPWNLMGYQGSVSQRGANRKPIRYLQWKKCKRG